MLKDRLLLLSYSHRFTVKMSFLVSGWLRKNFIVQGNLFLGCANALNLLNSLNQ